MRQGRAGGRWWWITAVYAVVIAIGAVAPVPPEPTTAPPWLDKFLHLCEYLLFAWCMVQGLRTSGPPTALALSLVFTVAAGYGAMLEGLQGWLPYRSAEWLDAVANGVGAALGLWVGVRWPTARVRGEP